MKKSTMIIVIAIIAVLAVGGIVYATTRDEETADTASDSSNSSGTDNSTTPDTDDTATASDEVEIENYAFSPTTITVKAGTKVTWTNKDNVGHDVTPDDPTAEFAKSELLGEGESYSVTFDTPGTYTYHCSPHPYMKGNVVVTE